MTKIKIYFIGFLFTSFLYSADNSVSKIKDEFRIYAQKQSDGVMVNWWSSLGTGWPLDLKGFWLVRRESGSDKWVKLNKKILYPRVVADMDFSIMNLPKSEIDRLNNKLKTVFTGSPEAEHFGKKINQPSGTDLIATQRAARYAYMRKLYGKDFSIFGFSAFLDTSAEPGKNYEYGLIGDFKEIGESEVLVTFPLRNSTLPIEVKQFSVKNKSTSYFIYVDVGDLKYTSLFLYKLYIKYKKEDEFKFVRDFYFTGLDRTNRVKISKSAIPEGSKVYLKLVPLNIYREELKPVTYYQFEPAKVK
ncbi:MAG: hypothetical protein MK193_03010 [Lentisphaeria bacterium]|nr:hypothetical protein [Lentisphaeria bacterium]